MRDIEQYVSDYTTPGFEDYQVKYRRKKVLEILERYKPESVLEIGVGMEPLFRYADWRYRLWTIAEPGGVMFRNAVRLANDMAESNRIRLYNELFPTRLLDNEKYDFIICSSLLHEVEETGDFLRGIADACTDETIVHINVPNANSFHRVLAKGMGLMDDVHDFSDRNLQMQQHKVFDMESLKAEVENAGFTVCDCGSYFVKPFTHSQMYRMMEEGIIDEKTLDGLYAISGGFNEYGSEIYVNVKLA